MEAVEIRVTTQLEVSTALVMMDIYYRVMEVVMVSQFLFEHCKITINYFLLDVNECETSNGGCAHTCHNTIGTYYCVCNSGYYVSSNGHSCLGK